MGKTHEDSVREMAAKTPYKVGEIQDKIVLIKAALMEVAEVVIEPERYGKIEKLKAAGNFLKVIPLVKSLPRPTKDNCKYPNSQRLIEIRDSFMPHIAGLGIRAKVLEAAIDAVIIVYEYDEPYRFLIDTWIEAISKIIAAGEWLPKAWWLQGKPIHYTWWEA